MNNGPAWSEGMVYLQDKNHFIVLTAEALPAPPPGGEQSVYETGWPGPARLPLGGPDLHARRFPNRALKPGERRREKEGNKILFLW